MQNHAQNLSASRRPDVGGIERSAALIGACRACVEGLELLEIFLEALFVERHLTGRERREVVDDVLFREFIENPRIGLHASQQERSRDLAEAVDCAGVPVLFDGLDVFAAELRRGSEEPGLQDREDRPVFGQTVFDRRAGQRHNGVGREFLSGARLTGLRILDGLRFVENEKAKMKFGELREFALQKSVGGNENVRTVGAVIELALLPVEDLGR